MERKIMLENVIKGMYHLTGGDEQVDLPLKDIVYRVKHQLRDQGPIANVDVLMRNTLQELTDIGLVQPTEEGYRLVAPEAEQVKRRRSMQKTKSPMKNKNLTKSVPGVRTNTCDLSYDRSTTHIQPIPEKSYKLIREPPKKSVLERSNPLSTRNPNMSPTLEHCDFGPKAQLEHRQCSCSKRHSHKHQIRKPL